MHRLDDPTIGKAGIALDRRVKSMSEFLGMIRSKEYGVLVDGKEYSIDELHDLN